MLDKRNLYRLPWSMNDNPIAWLEITDVCNMYCEGCYRQRLTGHKSLEEIKDGDFSSLSRDDQLKVRQELDRIIGGAEVNAFTDELKNRAEITIPEQSN